MKKIILILLVGLILSTPSFAWIHGKPAGGGTGDALLLEAGAGNLQLEGGTDNLCLEGSSTC